MKPILALTGLLLVLALFFFSWRSAASADRERVRAFEAEAQARASVLATGMERASRPAASLEQPSSTDPTGRIAQSPDAQTAARLEAMEERLAQLETAVRLLSARPVGTPVDALDTPDAIEKALRAIRGSSEERARRIQLLERFLELFPDDPRAAAMLEELIAEDLGSHPKLSLAALDRFGSRVVKDPLDLDKIRANVLIQNHRFDEGRSYYERVLRAAPNAEVSADASFWIAYSYVDESNFAEARARFEALIAQNANDTSAVIASLVSGAKNQLLLIEQYQAKKN